MRLRPSSPAFVRRLGLSASGVALVAVAGLLAAGCGGGSVRAVERGAGDQPPTTTAAETGGAGTASAEQGTLEFGMTDDEFATRVEKVQTLIASCMTEAGFEYIPADVETVQRAMRLCATSLDDPGGIQGSVGLRRHHAVRQPREGDRARLAEHRLFRGSLGGRSGGVRAHPLGGRSGPRSRSRSTRRTSREPAAAPGQRSSRCSRKRS